MPVAFVPDGLAGLRADVGAARLFGLSRSRVEQAAEQGKLLLGGRAVAKSELLSPGLLLEVDIAPVRAVEIRPQLADGLEIVYEDADLVVIDKPAGVAAHPSTGWSGASVTEHLAAAGYPSCPSGPAERKGVVSRLDVGTSGLMVVAMSALGFSRLKAAFQERTVHKVYHSLVQGYPNPSAGTINAPIGHAHTGEWKMAITPEGREAITHYELLESVFKASLLEVRLETGRTHQIRVHMAGIHHTCVGDILYGADPSLAREVGLTRQWLHAVELGFVHPRSGENLVFRSGYSADLTRSLEHLRLDGPGDVQENVG